MSVDKSDIVNLGVELQIQAYHAEVERLEAEASASIAERDVAMSRLQASLVARYRQRYSAKLDALVNALRGVIGKKYAWETTLENEVRDRGWSCTVATAVCTGLRRERWAPEQLDPKAYKIMVSSVVVLRHDEGLANMDIAGERALAEWAMPLSKSELSLLRTARHADDRLTDVRVRQNQLKAGVTDTASLERRVRAAITVHELGSLTPEELSALWGKPLADRFLIEDGHDAKALLGS